VEWLKQALSSNPSAAKERQKSEKKSKQRIVTWHDSTMIRVGLLPNNKKLGRFWVLM
jgi:hypothetical protein